MVQLGRNDGHRVQDVADAFVEELLGFLERRNGDAARARRELPPDNVGALARLDVGPEAHAEPVHARLHAQDVALHARQFEQQDGRLQIGWDAQGRGQ